MLDQPPARRRFQFRLRTLMIAVTLLAVASWVVADRQRLIRERDDEIKKQQIAERVDTARIAELVINQNELLQTIERLKERERLVSETEQNARDSVAKAHESRQRALSALQDATFAEARAREQIERDKKLIQLLEDMLLP